MKKNIEKYLKELKEEIILERFDYEAKTIIYQKKLKILLDIREKEVELLNRLVISKSIDTLLSKISFYERVINSLNEKFDYYNVKSPQK